VQRELSYHRFVYSKEKIRNLSFEITRFQVQLFTWEESEQRAVFIWLKDNFFPRKPTGKLLLILDGCNPLFQPLDRSLLKSSKANYCEAVRKWIYSNPDRKITQLKFCQLLKAATNKNATVGFEAIGIFPLNTDVFRSTHFIC
jgi:hypothetical protein